MEKAPYILLIDLDGTIQGDITPQLKEYVLQKSLGVKLNKKLLAIDYKKGLLRPYFNDFMNMIDTDYKNKVELFVYTASEKKWANYIVPIIESVTNVKFNRPIFTREQCNMNNNMTEKVKSISIVKPAIIKTLKKQYKSITNNDIINKIYLIDNNYVLKEANFLIKCPTYDKAIFINVLRTIDDNIKQSKFKDICKVILNYDCNNKWEMMQRIYDDAFKKFIYYDEKNSVYENDKFWEKVKFVFENNKQHNMKVIINHLKEIIKVTV